MLSEPKSFTRPAAHAQPPVKTAVSSVVYLAEEASENRDGDRSGHQCG